MDTEEFRKYGKDMVDFIADYLDDVNERRVTPEVHPGYLCEALPAKAPVQPDTWEDIVKDLDEFIMPGVTHWQHHRFHAYFPAGNSYPSILADMLSDAIGCVGFSWAACPACTELEIVVMDWLGKMIGLPNEFLHDSGQGGGVIQVYNTISDEANSCVEKSGMLGFVKLRQLDVDCDFSLRGDTLSEAIAEDRKLGLIPFYVCATLGTTACCSYDNLHEIGQVCHKEGLWLHLDAAYAGNALICPEYRKYLKGVEYTTSLNINPNKWMLVNFDCSAMWVRDQLTLTESLTVDPIYLRHAHNGKALGYRTEQEVPVTEVVVCDSNLWRFWTTEVHSKCETSYTKYPEHNIVLQHVRLARKFEELVNEDDRFEILGKVTLGLVCFRLKGKNELTQRLLRAINLSGKLHMVPALINDKYIIRFALCNQKACDEDVLFAWNLIQDFATNKVLAEGVNCSQEETAYMELERDGYLDVVGVRRTRCSSVISGSLTDARQRRSILRAMSSDPKCYNPKVLEMLSSRKKHNSFPGELDFDDKDDIFGE